MFEGFYYIDLDSLFFCGPLAACADLLLLIKATSLQRYIGILELWLCKCNGLEENFTAIKEYL